MTIQPFLAFALDFGSAGLSLRLWAGVGATT